MYKKLKTHTQSKLCTQIFCIFDVFVMASNRCLIVDCDGHSSHEDRWNTRTREEASETAHQNKFSHNIGQGVKNAVDPIQSLQLSVTLKRGGKTKVAFTVILEFSVLQLSRLHIHVIRYMVLNIYIFIYITFSIFSFLILLLCPLYIYIVYFF